MDKQEYFRQRSSTSYNAESATIEGPSNHGFFGNFSGDSNLPPTYIERETSLRDRVQQLAEEARCEGQELPILDYPREHRPSIRYGTRSPELNRQSEIVKTYFEAIKSKKDEIVALFIECGLVTTETTNEDGRTPLLAAIEVGNVRTVQQLMDFDADVNAFGVTAGLPRPRYGKAPPELRRTPLQFAAEKGNMTIAKLLMETYQADDSIIGPDGQHALRLAAANGHREIVQYLPARRGGGWRRWKTKHHKAMRRVKKATKNIYKFFKIFLYYIPKFFLWDAPKHLVVRPLIKGARWLSEHHKELPTIVAEWLKKTGKRIAKWAKKVPKKIWEIIEGIPEVTKDFVQWIWKAIKKIPKAAEIVFLWIWGGVKKIGIAIGNFFRRLFSFIHTALAAIASFFRHLKLKDVWDGFKVFLHAIFVDGPKKLWKWLSKFGDVSLRVMETLFGCLGCIVWWMLRGIVELFIYVPKKLGEILAAFAQSFGGGCKEVLIWINPKRS